MPTAAKLDLYKLHKDEYAAPRTPRLVTVKPAMYLTIAGQGEPGGELFQKQTGALYGMAFTVKMAKNFAGQDYAVCKLEGLWSKVGASKAMQWQVLIRLPDFIRADDLRAAADALVKKGKGDGVRDVRLEKIDEGQCVQVLHVGPYANEPETIARMEAFAREQGLGFHGLHHEIYLSDPRRVAPANLRTILRHPVRRTARV